MSVVEDRLAELGLELPVPPTPIANFVPWRLHGGLVWLAGQVNEWNGTVPFVGKVGREFDLAQGQQAARLCALNLLACLKLACGGDLQRVRGCVNVGGFVNCAPAFEFVPAVVNGASDLFVALWGEAGRHARTAVGVASLPRRAAVEVNAVFAVDALG
ncbi:RidA family protein [Aquabacterium sp. J223]|uniref:RidA family protein n=1 Tax=Aquabacterium sp. J223 TaxID=2898431 RepID=UPI0021AD6F92|nr:RidA family protein [Aquabacterium sp. J223]UUX97189.1 RidA family protein [Aquabacterium sp. J223]